MVEFDDRAAVGALVARLEMAWNAADAPAFAEFTAEADFVNPRGDHESGREAIDHGHAAIWSSVYAGSTIRYSFSQLREIAPAWSSPTSRRISKPLRDRWPATSAPSLR